MEHDVIQIIWLKLHAFAGDVITPVGQRFTVQINFVDTCGVWVRMTSTGSTYEQQRFNGGSATTTYKSTWQVT